MPLVSRVLGWAPPDNEDYVDVPIASSPPLRHQNPTFHISDPSIIRRPHRATSGIFESASPASSTSALSTEADSPAEKRVEVTGKHGDPSWVARPRNEFILFRCDYVRKHSREGKRVRRAPGAEAEKTLSKQAAEAWHHLSPEERLYWKEQANRERNEHARRHPDYRYKPRKSATARRRPSRSSPVKASAEAEEPEAPTDSEQSSLSRTSESHSGKSTPRRSASNPELNASDPVTRRLRSTASQGWIGIPPSPSSAERIPFRPPLEFNTIPSQVHGAPGYQPSSFSVPRFSSSLGMRPSEGIMHSNSSSLINWNGERIVSAPPQPTQFLSSASVVLPPPSCFSSGNVLLADFTTGGEPIPPSQIFAMSHAQYTAAADIWVPYSTNISIPPSTAENKPDDLSAHGTRPDFELVNYGMDPRKSHPMDILGGTREVSPETLFAMDTDDYFSPNF